MRFNVDHDVSVILVFQNRFTHDASRHEPFGLRTSTFIQSFLIVDVGKE